MLFSEPVEPFGNDSELTELTGAGGEVAVGVTGTPVCANGFGMRGGIKFEFTYGPVADSLFNMASIACTDDI